MNACAPNPGGGGSALALGYVPGRCPAPRVANPADALVVRANAAAGGNGTAAKPLRSISEGVARARPGQTVQVLAGTYRETIVIGKPVSIVGEPGAIVKGSDLAANWTREGNYWTTAYQPRLTAPVWVEGYTTCRQGSEGRCRFPDQVFLNGKALRQKVQQGGLKAGEFWVGNGRLYLADNPTGGLVEVTTRPNWIRAADDLAGVTISGLTFTHAAPEPQRGALVTTGANWLISNNDISHSATVGIETFGSCVTVRGNRIHHHGQLGIKGETPDLVVDANDIYSNNTEEFDPNWEAGGSKWVRSRNVLLVNNRAFDNDGSGLWCDIDCSAVTIRGNRAYENTYNGINYEISDNAVIENNDVWLNGSALREWALGAGIYVLNSRNVIVRDNLVAWNKDGISILQTERGQWTPVYNVAVTGNTIIQAPAKAGQAHALAWYGNTITDTNANNRSSGNKFWLAGSDIYFAWGAGDASTSMDWFLQTPGGSGSSLLDTNSRNRLLTTRSVPTNPR